MRRLLRFLALALVASCATSLPIGRAAEPAAAAATFSAEQIEFFETKIRPLLARECYECHSAQAKALKGSLRLDSRAALLKGGDSGEAIVPGEPTKSGLIQAVRWKTFEMPPDGKLRDDEIAALEKWIELGAPWPEEKSAPAVEQRTYDWPALRAAHWAWQPVASPPLPEVQDTAWPKNEIDRFVLAKLEAAGLKPSPPAPPHVWLRRVYLDLIGLPPTPEAVAAFARATADDWDAAARRVVEHLLEQPQYGERWGRHWLDVARYSDGYGGFLDKAGLPNAWRYRDWVVAALNRDLPYDEFVRLQLTGDLVSPELAVATGFLALGPTYISDGGDPEATAQAKSETLDDRVDTVCRGLMAVTVACARCHDHRFDPFPQLDYYSIAGVFNNTRPLETPLVPASETRRYDGLQKQIDALNKQVGAVRAAIRKEGRRLTPEERADIDRWEAEAAALLKEQGPKYPFAHAIAEAGTRDMPLAIRGNLLRPGPEAPRRFLRIVAGDDPPRFTQGSGRRELAAAITSPTNPLTWRVAVNRVWQQHFGFGLVRTPSNFGTLGEKPSHPELLDWLADRFAKGSGARGQGRAADSDSHPSPLSPHPYSLKNLHRSIVLSATYRQDSASRDSAFAVDGDNRLLWRMHPRRLDVEAWRDSLLSATGELDLKVGGPPIDDIAQSARRTLYASVSRNGDRFASDTFLRMFDFPVPRATSEGRTSSVVPQQSLFLMNSPFMVARARALAARLQREAATDADRIDRAYLLLYGRRPTADERTLGTEFLQTPSSSQERLTSWQQYAQVLLSASETMYWE
jgi:cytochrome c553